MRARAITTAAALGLVLAASLTGCQSVQAAVHAAGAGSPGTSASTGDSITATFDRVVDGDTITVKPTAELPSTDDYDEHSVRLLGIDAPEMNKMESAPPECGAQAATDHLKQLLAGATTITLAHDPQSDHTDRFGRTLAYVELDGHDLNLEQVAGGYAEAWYPYGEPTPTRFGSYESAQRDAKSAGTGSWGTCDFLGR